MDSSWATRTPNLERGMASISRLAMAGERRRKAKPRLFACSRVLWEKIGSSSDRNSGFVQLFYTDAVVQVMLFADGFETLSGHWLDTFIEKFLRVQICRSLRSYHAHNKSRPFFYFIRHVDPFGDQTHQSIYFKAVNCYDWDHSPEDQYRRHRFGRTFIAEVCLECTVTEVWRFSCSCTQIAYYPGLTRYTLPVQAVAWAFF